MLATNECEEVSFAFRDWLRLKSLGEIGNCVMEVILVYEK
jgi:hypothetical protein